MRRARLQAGAFVFSAATASIVRRGVHPLATFIAHNRRPSTLVSATRDLTSRSSSLVIRGVASGLVAAAAVTGLLLGLGHRVGTAWRPLNAAAHTLLGSRADGVWSFHSSVTPMGGLVVLTMSLAAGFAVARIASSFRTLHIVVAAIGVAFAGYLIHLHVVARTPGGLAALLTVGEMRALYLTLALSLAAGMRFAFPPLERVSGR